MDRGPVKCLDPAGYMEEINSLHYFRRDAGCFALQIVAITDWGRKYMDMGFKYPIPAFPQFLFTPSTGVTPGWSPSPCQAVSGEHTQRRRVPKE